MRSGFPRMGLITHEQPDLCTRQTASALAKEVQHHEARGLDNFVPLLCGI